jgi:hypothetical protein
MQVDIREPGGSQRDLGKLFFFKPTQIGCRTSWLIVAIISHSSLSVAATREHACYVLFFTCPELIGRDGKLGEPDRRRLATHGT